ncbi:AMP-binding protein [Dermacoccus nishinomiyaensis]
MPNMADPIWTHATSAPERPALRSPSTTWNYATLRDKAAAFAGHLRDRGISQGDRVLLIAPSVPEFAVAYYAAQAVGAIAVTLNTMSTPAEIEYVATDSGARHIVAWHASAAAGERVASKLTMDLVILDAGADAATRAPLDEPVERADDDTAILLYTSGTTGRPKGVQLTVANLFAVASAFITQLNFASTEKFGTALPLFHVFGQCVCMNTVMLAGGSFSVLSPFEPRAMLAMIRDHEINVVAGVPTMWNYLVHVEGDFGPKDCPDLRLAASGGASLPVEVIAAFERRFACTILEGYGLTETTGAASYHRDGIEQRAGTVGVALPDTEIVIESLDGGRAPVGEVGQVLVKGSTVMKGYWNNEAATAADLSDGWLRTGDLGRLDGEGYLAIVDRAKDLIIRGGYNVYPREVEEVLYSHPDVVEAAVIGVPDERYGEEVAAVVVLAPGRELSADELRAWLKEQLSAYKVPHLIRFDDALPKGATGKILKRAIEWTTDEGATP